MANHIAGLFPDRASAEQAIVDLRDAGFEPSKIGVLLRDRDEAISMARANDISSTEGAVTGGLIGGSLGALLAAVGALSIPGIGPFISGGVLITLIGGAAGWLVGGLATLGIPREEAEYYEHEVQQGRALITVDAGEREEEARAIMLRDGAEDLRGRDFNGTASASPIAKFPVETETTDPSESSAPARSLHNHG